MSKPLHKTSSFRSFSDLARILLMTTHRSIKSLSLSGYSMMKSLRILVAALPVLAASFSVSAALTKEEACTTVSGTLVQCFGLTASPGATVSGDALDAKGHFLGGKTSVGTLNFSQYPLPADDFSTISRPSDAPGLFTGSSNTALFSLSDAPAGPFVLPDTTVNLGLSLRDLGRFDTTQSLSDPNGMILETGTGFTMTFATAVQAFGFYGTDIGDFGGELILELYESDAANASVSSRITVFSGAPVGDGGPTSDPQGGSLLFFGFSDSTKTYKKIKFVHNGEEDGFGYDDMIVASLSTNPPNPTPEPASLALLGAALAAAGLSRRRARRTS